MTCKHLVTGTDYCIRCQVEQQADTIKSLQSQLKEAHQNSAFYKCCALSGESVADGDEPFPPAEKRHEHEA